ncbi:M23 family metallopeptidase [Leucobacter sp. NPDC077196]|uniref:M23 family metallopeptidase n=1 Tax=Leucobacter sp. NPDC077196 TaxID=3154959 RepID=UPI00341E76A5
MMPEALWPVAERDFVVTGEFGNSPGYYAQFGQLGHNGKDIGVWLGTPVYAMYDGEVVFEGWGQNHPWMGGIAGICVLLRHWWGYTGYAHLSATVVNIGQWVGKGQQVALSGDTSSSGAGSTGPHLHAETLPLAPNFLNGFAGRVNPASIAAFVGFAGTPSPAPVPAHSVPLIPERSPMLPVSGSSTALPQKIPADGRHHLLLRKDGKVTRKRNQFAAGPCEMTHRNVAIRATAKPGAVLTVSICRYDSDNSETVIDRVELPANERGVVRALIPVTEKLEAGQGLYLRVRATADATVTLYKFRGFKQR